MPIVTGRMADISIASVEIANDRLKAFSADKAAEIRDSMEDLGLLSPILVSTPGKSGRHRLIGGLHRLEAAKLLGWEAIPAILLDLSGIKARLAEIDENLARGTLSPLEWARHFAERKAVYEDLHPETRHGGDRRSTKFANLATWSDRFTSSAAKQFSMSERSIHRALERYREIDPDVQTAIANTWIAHKSSALDALARLSSDEQRQAVALLLDEESEDRPRNVAAAAAIVRGERPAAPAPDEVAFKALLSAWDRAPKGVRRRFVDHLVAQGELADGAVAT